jgi:nicotinamidase/pyrazinamidase
MILRKGLHRTIDSYSAFYENDRRTPTGLIGYLRERSLTRVVLAGLAFDFLRPLLGRGRAARRFFGVRD